MPSIELGIINGISVCKGSGMFSDNRTILTDDVTYSDDTDVDYTKGMIPHHQGAIDMAKVALQYAKDPAVLKLAGEVVTAQKGEISFMNDWLKRMGK
jgi:uncharacterized protein (DUF305 family)